MSLKWVVKHRQVTQAIESINLSYPQTLEIFSKSIHYNRPQSNSQALSSHGRSINSRKNNIYERQPNVKRNMQRLWSFMSL